MGIRVLPPELAGKIAAGEVVERPASAVKELLENAIDAQATDIKIEIGQGGRRLIRLVDNGTGIPADEVELAFARHSTSKLSDAAELLSIRTLGFRGEALASIAAVARVTIVTQTADERTGTLLRLEGGAVTHRESKGIVPGTAVTVENLFYNTPARLKFLRSDATESSHILATVTSYALAYPELRFTLLRDGRLALRTTGTGELYNALIEVLGLQTAQQMLEVQSEPGREDGLGVSVPRVSGYVSSPTLHRSNRKDMLFLVNRRWVQDRSLAYAVEQAYHSLLPSGRHPLTVLNVEIDPAEIDVNIHPTKREIRFRDQRHAFTAVQRAVRRTLVDEGTTPLIDSRLRPVAGAEWERIGRLAHVAPGRVLGRGEQAMEIQRTADQVPVGMAAQHRLAGLPMLRVVGQLRQTYIVAEGPDGVYLIDQHSAHERIQYEKLTAQHTSRVVPSQSALEPITVDLAPRQASIVEEHSELLQDLGFEIEPFGTSTFLVRRVPASLVGRDVPAALAEILEQSSDVDADLSWEEHALITLSCHSAVRAGQTLTQEEMRDLVRQLEATTLPQRCPHGRPTMIHLSSDQLEREFGRS